MRHEYRQRACTSQATICQRFKRFIWNSRPRKRNPRRRRGRGGSEFDPLVRGRPRRTPFRRRGRKRDLGSIGKDVASPIRGGGRRKALPTFSSPRRGSETSRRWHSAASDRTVPRLLIRCLFPSFHSTRDRPERALASREAMTEFGRSCATFLVFKASGSPGGRRHGYKLAPSRWSSARPSRSQSRLRRRGLEGLANDPILGRRETCLRQPPGRYSLPNDRPRAGQPVADHGARAGGQMDPGKLRRRRSEVSAGFAARQRGQQVSRG
jgi:hypothetical protein